jgi:8-oxo-dGTP pyrophosphatase MutT (NUDIX family)
MSDCQPEVVNTFRRGVIAVIQKDERFLVIRRSRFVRAPRKYCFPGGEIEEGETEIDALKREMVEELNVVVRPIKRIWTNETASGVHLSWWTTDIGFQRVKVNPAEVEAFHWLRMDEILARKDLLDTNRRFMLGLRSGAITTS